MLGELSLLEVLENSHLTRVRVERLQYTDCSDTKNKLLTKCLKGVLKILEITSAEEFLFTEVGPKKFPKKSSPKQYF